MTRQADQRRARARERERVRDVASRGLISQTLFDDDTQQLDYEVRHFYLHVVAPAERELLPLRRFAFSPTFVADCRAQASAVSRLQLLTALVEVVIGRARLVTGLGVRPLRVTEDSPQQLIRSDGATAWRANVSNNTPAARRLMWWEVPGGLVEFARLAVHDDTSMPLTAMNAAPAR